MLKGSQALFAAIESGSPVPTNEAQRRELSAEWQRTGDAATLAKLEAVEAQHTPGPWMFDAGGKDTPPSVFVDGRKIAECRNGFRTDRDRCLANARLIAAAPELLAIAQIVDEWESCTDYKIVRAKWGIPPDQNVYDFIRAARKAAIAKAGGAK